MEEARELLERAANEIRTLRNQNDIMGARLGMFDDVMSALHGKPGVNHKHGGMHPDIVYDIDKHLQANHSSDAVH